MDLKHFRTATTGNGNEKVEVAGSKDSKISANPFNT